MEFLWYVIGAVMVLSGIMNVVLISRYNPNSKKNLEKRMKLVEQMREYDKKHKKGE